MVALNKAKREEEEVKKMRVEEEEEEERATTMEEEELRRRKRMSEEELRTRTSWADAKLALTLIKKVSSCCAICLIEKKDWECSAEAFIASENFVGARIERFY